MDMLDSKKRAPIRVDLSVENGDGTNPSSYHNNTYEYIQNYNKNRIQATDSLEKIAKRATNWNLVIIVFFLLLLSCLQDLQKLVFDQKFYITPDHVFRIVSSDNDKAKLEVVKIDKKVFLSKHLSNQEKTKTALLSNKLAFKQIDKIKQKNWYSDEVEIYHVEINSDDLEKRAISLLPVSSLKQSSEFNWKFIIIPSGIAFGILFYLTYVQRLFDKAGLKKTILLKTLTIYSLITGVAGIFRSELPLGLDSSTPLFVFVCISTSFLLVLIFVAIKLLMNLNATNKRVRKFLQSIVTNYSKKKYYTEISKEVLSKIENRTDLV